MFHLNLPADKSGHITEEIMIDSIEVRDIEPVQGCDSGPYVLKEAVPGNTNESQCETVIPNSQYEQEQGKEDTGEQQEEDIDDPNNNNLKATDESSSIMIDSECNSGTCVSQGDIPDIIALNIIIPSFDEEEVFESNRKESRCVRQ